MAKYKTVTKSMICTPCIGECHNSGGDGCMLCINASWGWMPESDYIEGTPVPEGKEVHRVSRRVARQPR